MYFFAFVFALGFLVSVHEYGHYRMAVSLGVKVLRFSIGLGPVLWRWRLARSETEFVIAALPLGGYVRMLDQREAEVAPDQRRYAFDTQRLRVRVAIVAAGPLANLALAVLLFALASWIGTEEPLPVLSRPAAGTLAYQAGFSSGDRVLRLGTDADHLHDVLSFDELRWALTQGILDGEPLVLEVQRQATMAPLPLTLDLRSMKGSEVDAAAFRQVGIVAPFSDAVIAAVQPGGAGDKAGLQVGDRVTHVDGQVIDDSAHLVERIRQSTRDGQALTQNWQVQRQAGAVQLQVVPAMRQEANVMVGRLDIALGGQVARYVVRRGPVDGFLLGAHKTWEMAVVSVQMLGRMLVGQASVKNLSGPISIADYAGKSANQGLTSYLLFLAVISVSLGVLNLLPLPVLDGGHLMYYLWEGVTGRALSEAWLNRLQRGGIAVLVAMMSVALFNDASRFLGHFSGWRFW